MGMRLEAKPHLGGSSGNQGGEGTASFKEVMETNNQLNTGRVTSSCAGLLE